MRAKLFLITIMVLLSYGYIQAQTLRGTVYDEATRKPIPEVFVYLDGTSIYATTNAEGKFELNTNKVINTQLVLSHISYNTVTVANPFLQMPSTFYLKEKDLTLKEIVIQADQFTRAQKMKAFREQFLGITKAGKSCEILAEEDIRVSYDFKSQTLIATSDKPITIINHFLGYKILFTLVDFRVQFFGNKINHEYAKQSFFAGTSSFIDLKPNEKRIQKRRDEVYKNSSLYFFKNLANNTLVSSGHKVFNKQFPANPQTYFSFKDTLSQTLISIKPDTNINKSKIGIKDPMFGLISVLYDKKTQSEIYFLIPEFLVDQYGNISDIDKVLFGGHMGSLRVGDMLPLDYEPN